MYFIPTRNCITRISHLRRIKMRSRKVLFIAGLLAMWTCVTYYFVLRTNVSSAPYGRVIDQKLSRIEDEARIEYELSGKLMQGILDVLKVKPIQPQKVVKQDVAPKERPIDIVALPPDHPLSLPEPPQKEQRFEELVQFKEKEEARQTVVIRMPNGEPVIPILVIACNRVSIKRCLDKLLQYRPSAEQFPIIVSQDCGDVQTKTMILSYESQVSLIEQPDQSDIYPPPREKKFKGYYKIARHYGWALNTTFHRGYEFVVIVEDDLDVAPDFYEYFLSTHAILKQDPSLWCVSAWNDNGKAKYVDTSHPELLYRSDFFPGLGWMLTKDLWWELSVKWPKSFWDDWIRHPEQRKERACIRPEISRTATFGKFGVSNGLFFDKYLQYIVLNDNFVPFTKRNLSYLLKDNYDRTFLKDVYTYPIVTYAELRRNLVKVDGPVRIQYTTREQYIRTASSFGLMVDFKSGVPRTAYHGIVSFYYNSRRVYLAPNVNWKGYDLWS